MIDTKSGTRQRPRMDPRAAWEDRTALVKKEAEAERKATDLKTARLKILRLEKEAADKAAAPEAAPKPRARKKVLTIKA